MPEQLPPARPIKQLVAERKRALKAKPKEIADGA
jgi:hypothetical protein